MRMLFARAMMGLAVISILWKTMPCVEVSSVLFLKSMMRRVLSHL